MLWKSPGGDTGVLNIAATNFVYDIFNIGGLCRKMRQNYPGVKLKIYDIQRSPQVAEYIRRGQADVGFFMVGDPRRQCAALKCKKLCTLQMMSAIPARHRARCGISAAEYRRARWNSLTGTTV